MIDDILQFIKSCSVKDLYLIRKISSKRISELNQAKKSQDIDVKCSEFAVEMAETLWQSVKINFPIMQEPDLKSWAVDIDRLERIDKIDRGLIKAVLLWSQQDSFWKNNIRSASSLRRNFVKVYASAKMKHDFQQERKGKIYKV